jgi:hypothetical protein
MINPEINPWQGVNPKAEPTMINPEINPEINPD